MSAEPCTGAQDAAGSLMVENLVAAAPGVRPEPTQMCALPDLGVGATKKRLGLPARAAFY